MFISIFKIIELANDHYTVESGTMLKSSSNNYSKIMIQIQYFFKNS
jgi:hypothetical protein